MIEKYYQGIIPAKGNIKDEQGRKIEEKIKLLSGELSIQLAAGSDFNFSASLEKVWELINMANKYVEDTKPWNLVKENKTEELEAFIRLLVDVIREVADKLYPFMPHTAGLIMEQLGKDKIKKAEPLFPRIEISKRK